MLESYVCVLCVHVLVVYFPQKGAALIILLAGLLTSKAHDIKSSELNDEGWLSSTVATASYAENTSKASVVSSASVVVNWSSICTDLCG